VQWPTLHFHHIDEEPSNSLIGNLLVLCPTHHQMATSKNIDRKHCQLLKRLLVEFSLFEIPPEGKARVKLLFSLGAELHINLSILTDSVFDVPNDGTPGTPRLVIYPRLYHAVLDQILCSGLFINDQDNLFFTLLYAWAGKLHGFNRRLAITEDRVFSHLSDHNELHGFKTTLAEGTVLAATKVACVELLQHMTKEYGEECGISMETQFFHKSKASGGAQPE
jgi:hypothetical protein